VSDLWIIGAGGHAKVVIETARAMKTFEPVGVIDDYDARWNSTVLGVPVFGPVTPERLRELGVARAVVAIGANRARAELARRLDGLVAWVTLVHPSAIVAPSVRLGEGTVVFAGAIVQPDTVVGRHVILNTGSSVDHDGVVGDFAHIAPGARLAGGVRIGEGVLVGIGSCVIPGRAVGDWATVGAGAAVVTDIPPGVVAKGVPARSAAASGDARERRR